jgi:hypothetical protein
MTLNNPVFTKINESFSCLNCGCTIPPAVSTCRDHCPHCLFSLHVDINPGDRAANCGGKLHPKAYSTHKKKGYMIHYVCEKCGAERVNKFLAHDENASDNFDALLKLSGITRT